MGGSGTGNPVVTAALAKMAMLRQAEVSALTLDLYTSELAAAGVDVPLIVAACARIQVRPRLEGETAFPSFGVLLAECRESKRRQEVERLEALAAMAPKALPPAEAPRMTEFEAKSWMRRFKGEVAKRRTREAS